LAYSVFLGRAHAVGVKLSSGIGAIRFAIAVEEIEYDEVFIEKMNGRSETHSSHHALSRHCGWGVLP
jgi:hypothetical protein